ncbi:MAG: 50S ribosomal protein L30 [Deltaproteobacteria bacterium]|jgi:large subunit ribosomal protein L30|nr:50S ribosomal protein L30 [Deltaproteobacteria bacterium]
MSGKKIRVTQVKSEIGYDRKQRATLRGLGLRRMHHSVEVEDTPAVRGMVKKITHLLRVEE